MTEDAAHLFESDGELTTLARRLYRREVDEHGRWPSVPDLRIELDEEHGFEVIGNGAGRLVVDASDVYPALEGTVVKFALPAGGGSDGRVQNRVEAAIAVSDHWFAGYVVPHRYSDSEGYVVCQPYCTTPSDRRLESAISTLSGLGVDLHDIREVDSWGLHYGEARLIDYGLPHTSLDLPDAAREAAEEVATEEGLDL